MARIVRAGEASSEAERRNEGSTKCVRNPEKPDFCEAKSHPKNKNSKLDICPHNKNIVFFFLNLDYIALKLDYISNKIK